MRQFVIKRKLRSILNDPVLIKQIDQMAENVSNIQFLASHYLHKRSMQIIMSENAEAIREEFDRPVKDFMFKSDFFAVKSNTRNPVRDADFMDWLAEVDPPILLPDALHCDNVLQAAMKMYKTNYSNHIKMRAKSMFRKFCKAVLFATGRVWPKSVLNKLINRAVDWFFHFTEYEPNNRSPVRTVIETFIWEILIDDEDVVRGFLHDSLNGDNFYRFAKYFIKMQLYVHHYNNTHPERMVKSFRVIPLHNYHKRMVMIDTETMRKMRNMHVDKRRHDVNPPKSDAWSLFRLEGLEKDYQRFDFKIMSDGMTAAIFMMRLKPHEYHIDLNTPSKIKGVSTRPKDPPKVERFDHVPREVIANNNFDVKIGIDPGAKTMAACTKQHQNDNLSEECYSIESKKYKQLAGTRKNEYNRRSITGRFDNREREAREASDTLITSNGPDYAEFIRHKLEFYNTGKTVYHHPFILQMKFDAYREKLAAMYAVAREIIGRSANNKLNKALIFFGHWRWRANSPIKGHRTPLLLLRFCLQQLGSTVIVINGYRTSKLCNFCGETMINEGRNSLCVDCHPIQRTLAPAAVWRMNAHKSFSKRNPGAPKIREYTRDRNQPLERNNQNHSPMNWNRDYNGSRAILSKGLDLVAGRPLPRNYLKTTRNVPQRRRFARR